MDPQRFDDLARAVAGRLTRRSLLKLIGFGFVSGIAGNVRSQAALAASLPISGCSSCEELVDLSARLTSADATRLLNDACISINNPCTGGRNAGCTSVNGLRGCTVARLIDFAASSGCQVTVTGATEHGHAGGPGHTHGNGYKVDIRHTQCVTDYITSHFTLIGYRPDGTAVYTDGFNEYADEVNAAGGPHWDIVYDQCLAVFQCVSICPCGQNCNSNGVCECPVTCPPGSSPDPNDGCMCKCADGTPPCNSTEGCCPGGASMCNNGTCCAQPCGSNCCNKCEYCSDPSNGTCKQIQCPCQGSCDQTTGSCSAPACPAGQTCCTPDCVDLQTDNSNCGTCGNACTGGQVCVNGICQCQGDAKWLCNGVCTNIYDSDTSNCGFCGVQCGPNQLCCNGCCTDIYQCRGTTVYRVCAQQLGCNLNHTPGSDCSTSGDYQNCPCPPGVNGG